MNKFIKYLVSLFSDKPETVITVPEAPSIARQEYNEIMSQPALATKPLPMPKPIRMPRVAPQPKPTPVSDVPLAPHDNPNKVKVFARNGETALVYKVQRTSTGNIAQNGRVKLRRLHHPRVVIEVSLARFVAACRPTLPAAA